ncbi:MAG: hypothetical protein K0S76_2643 [Herbinix sp.]|jgi:hypothetical protein|nr:hypothetical protein [Herbinix sp.]
MLSIRIVDSANNIIATMYKEDKVSLNFTRSFQEGDRILIESSAIPIALKVTVDKTIAPASLWLAEPVMEFPIPLGLEHDAYPKDAFMGDEHTVSVEKMNEEEWMKYRIISENPLDRRGASTYYPHCTANVETRGESVFAARNTIDGNLANTDHGYFPYTSWGNNENPEAEIMIEFGREVTVDKIKILIRADFPHDNFWTQSTLIFSDGSTEVLPMIKTKEFQEFTYAPRTVTWVKLTKLKKCEEDPSPFPALSQWIIYGSQNDGKIK